MLIRYGLIHVVALLVGVLGCLGAWLATRRITARRPEHWARRLGLNRLLTLLGLLLLVAGPLALFTAGTTVWVVRDGALSELDHARFQLFGREASAPGPNGAAIRLAKGEGYGELLLNLSREPVMVETVQYGGHVRYGAPSGTVVPPGTTHWVAGSTIDAVSEPPDTLRVSRKAGVGAKTFVHRIR